MKHFPPLKDWFFYTDEPPTGITWPIPTLKELTAIVADGPADQPKRTAYTVPSGPQQPNSQKTNIVTLPTSKR